MRCPKVEKPVVTRVEDVPEAIAKRTHSTVAACALSGMRWCLMLDLRTLNCDIFASTEIDDFFRVARRFWASSSISFKCAQERAEAKNGISNQGDKRMATVNVRSHRKVIATILVESTII